MAEIRPERTQDIPAVSELNQRAFGRLEEGRLVDLVRRRDEPVISLVAVDSDQVVGHILFSPVSIESSQQTHRAVGLRPMAVRPDFQRQGIGRQLIEEGLQVCRQAGYEIVVVLGHPSYYPRFGFMLARDVVPGRRPRIRRAACVGRDRGSRRSLYRATGCRLRPS